MKKLFIIVILLSSYLSLFANTEKTFLIHAKTSLKIDDAQMCAVPNVAWTALKQNFKVIILFDASGVTAIEKGGLISSKTDLDKAKLPDRERNTLAEQLNTSIDKVPKNYGEYIHFLKDMGVKMYANETMMLLYKIEKDNIDKVVTPINLNKMVDLFKTADVYVAY